LAALFLRAFFLRLFLATTTSGSDDDDPTIVVARRGGTDGGRVVGSRGWMSTQEHVDDEGARTMAEEIRAEMVANVWKVVASAGDTVAEGDTLVILESMKMEIPVLAESDGTLAQLAVNEGDVVQEGDLIAVIE
jgi:acetyl/propionyl-CoA carboxylase alpha subunit